MGSGITTPNRGELIVICTFYAYTPAVLYLRLPYAYGVGGGIALVQLQ